MIFDTDSIKPVADALKLRKETIAVAESTTGGLISAGLLSMPGASSYYMGGTIIYTPASRRLFLAATSEKLKGVKPLSNEMGIFFAEAVREKLGATWGIAELGIAGPTGAPAYGISAGNSIVAVSGPVRSAVKIDTGHNDRIRNMEAFADGAFSLLKEVLIKTKTD